MKNNEDGRDGKGLEKVSKVRDSVWRGQVLLPNERRLE